MHQRLAKLDVKLPQPNMRLHYALNYDILEIPSANLQSY